MKDKILFKSEISKQKIENGSNSKRLSEEKSLGQWADRTGRGKDFANRREIWQMEANEGPKENR